VTAVAKRAANTNAHVASSRDLLERQAFEAFKAFVLAFSNLVVDAPVVLAPSEPEAESSDVMTADEAAVFLGVDRNTVYEYAGRGNIPHQRLGKRMLFRRGALVTWLDASLCKAASERKL
jgi:excisionase family DNA binding protein